MGSQLEGEGHMRAKRASACVSGHKVRGTWLSFESAQVVRRADDGDRR